jgi:hypothetical protein
MGIPASVRVQVAAHMGSGTNTGVLREIHPDRLPGYQGKQEAGAMSFDPALQGSYGVRERQFEPSRGQGPARKEWAVNDLDR